LRSMVVLRTVTGEWVGPKREQMEGPWWQGKGAWSESGERAIMFRSSSSR
jgi:hypothetical protein